jgi:hypothetical protein
MIVSESDVVGVAVTPNEAKSPLPVDPDAVLTLPIALQCLEMIAWHDGEFLEAARRVNHPKLPPGGLGEPSINPLHEPAFEQRDGTTIPERLDHRVM